MQTTSGIWSSPQCSLRSREWASSLMGHAITLSVTLLSSLDPPFAPSSNPSVTGQSPGYSSAMMSRSLHSITSTCESPQHSDGWASCFRGLSDCLPTLHSWLRKLALKESYTLRLYVVSAASVSNIFLPTWKNWTGLTNNRMEWVPTSGRTRCNEPPLNTVLLLVAGNRTPGIRFTVLGRLSMPT